MRGYCGIGIVGGKNIINVGTLWRSASILGASFMFTVNRRFPRQSSDTLKSWRHIPYYEYSSMDDLMEHLPFACVPVAVELDTRSRPLHNYVHPERAIYLLGAEDSGLKKADLDKCRDIIQIPGERCLNVAVAGSIVLFDRHNKCISE